MVRARLGQHFLRCRWVISTLIKAADINSDDTVLEVGPGTGVLTRELAKHAGKVIAVEKDERMAEELENSLRKEGINNVAVIPGDVLRIHKNVVLKSGRSRTEEPHRSFARAQDGVNSSTDYKVVANIPYYLTSRLIRLLLENGPRPNQIVLTIQKEVAERMCARPPQMNLLALSVQAFGKPEVIKTVPASCFSPQPKVESAIIKIADISGRFFEENSIDKARFFEILRRAFSQKRKTLARSLTQLLDKNHMLEAIKKAGLKDTARPQELSLEGWVKLAHQLMHKSPTNRTNET